MSESSKKEITFLSESSANATPKKDWRHLILLITISLIYIGIRVGHIRDYKEPKIYPDTSRYLAISEQPLTSLDFWAGGYPVVVPAVHKIFEQNPAAIAGFQSGVSMLTWVGLALAVAKSAPNKSGQALMFAIVLAFSLEGAILLWDWVILSESLSGSIFVLYLTGWLWFFRQAKWDWRPAIFTLTTGVLWMFTRDTNALLNLALALLIFGLALFTKKWRYTIFTAVFMLAYLISAQLAEIGGRWIGPNLSVIGTRILPDNDAQQFYIDQGMPVSAALLAFTGKKAGPVDAGFSDDPALIPFNEWHRANGKPVYVKFLLQTPIATILAPLQQPETLFNTQALFYFKPKGFEPILQSPLDGLLFFDYWNGRVLALSAIVFAVGIGLALWTRSPKWNVPLMMALFLYPHAFLIWHASGLDTARHAYLLRLHFNLTVLILGLYNLAGLYEILTPQWQRAFTRHRRQIEKYHALMMAIGLLMAALSLGIDFLMPGAGEFSIGYAQIAGFLCGAGLLGFGYWLKRSTIKA